MNILTPTFRRIAAGSALALVATGGTLLASPATAATSQTLNYLCNSPSLGNFPATASHAFADSAVYGGDLGVITTMTLPAPVVDGLRFFGITAVEGTATGQATLADAPISAEETVAKTAIPASGSMQLIADGAANTAPAGGVAQAGDTAAVGLVDGDGNEITASLFTYNADDVKSGSPTSVTCELVDGQVLTVGDVTISQAGTETAPALAYKKRSGKVVGTAVVDAPDSAAAPAGQVVLTLKRNGKKVGQSVTKDLSDGKAAASWVAPKSGSYKIVAKYLGNDNFIASTGSATKSF